MLWQVSLNRLAKDLSVYGQMSATRSVSPAQKKAAIFHNADSETKRNWTGDCSFFIDALGRNLRYQMYGERIENRE